MKGHVQRPLQNPPSLGRRFSSRQNCSQSCAGWFLPSDHDAQELTGYICDERYDATKASINSVVTSNPELEGYIDLYLIHAPFGGREARLGSWRAMAEAQREGKVRSLGVSNYSIQHLEELWKYIHEEGGGGVLSVGQWEVTPWISRRKWRDWCGDHGVVVQVFHARAGRGEYRY